MDAFSTAASATALVGTCAYIARGLSNTQKKLKRMDVTITALVTECWLMSAAFGQVARMIKLDTDAFNAHFGSSEEGDGEHPEAGLKSAIDCATMLMAQLKELLDRYHEKNADGAVSLSSKASFLWTEPDMRDVLETARHLGRAIGTLLTVMQTDSLATVRDTMKANAEALRAIADRTRTSYVTSVKEPSRKLTPNTTGASGKTGAASYYEEELIKSTVYKKAFQLRRKHKSTRQDIETARNAAPPGSIMESYAESFGDMTVSAGSQARGSVLIRNWDRLSAPVSRLMVGRLRSVIPWQPPRPDAEVDVMLRNAIKDGNIALAKACIDQGADLEAFDEKRGYRPLHAAVGLSRCEMVTYLLSKNVSTASVDNDCNNALHLASESSCISGISALIQAGAEVNVKGKEEYSPLHFAAANGRLSAITYLLSCNADLEARCRPPESLRPIYAALSRRQRVAVEILLGQEKSYLRPKQI